MSINRRKYNKSKGFSSKIAIFSGIIFLFLVSGVCALFKYKYANNFEDYIGVAEDSVNIEHSSVQKIVSPKKDIKGKDNSKFTIPLAISGSLDSVSVESIVDFNKVNPFFSEMSQDVARELSLKSLRLDRSKNFFKLSTKLKSSGVCGVGDLDIVKKDLKGKKFKDRLLLTVEQLFPDGSSKTVLSKSVFTYSFLNKQKLGLKLPVKSSGVYGLFVCGATDFRDEYNKYVGAPIDNSCVGKNVVSMSSLSSRQNVDQGKVQDSESNIYYFSPLLIKKSGIIVPSGKELKESNKVVEELVRVGLGERNGFLENKLLNYLEKTRSILPNDSFSSVKIDLPHLDATRCSKN